MFKLLQNTFYYDHTFVGWGQHHHRLVQHQISILEMKNPLLRLIRIFIALEFYSMHETSYDQMILIGDPAKTNKRWQINYLLHLYQFQAPCSFYHLDIRWFIFDIIEKVKVTIRFFFLTGIALNSDFLCICFKTFYCPILTEDVCKKWLCEDVCKKYNCFLPHFFTI